jgi:hypothetical protein
MHDLNRITGVIVDSAFRIHSKLGRLLDYRVGLLLNFGAPLMRDGIKRIANSPLAPLPFSSRACP